MKKEIDCSQLNLEEPSHSFWLGKMSGWVEGELALLQLKLPKSWEEKNERALGNGIQMSSKIWRYVFCFFCHYFVMLVILN